MATIKAIKVGETIYELKATYDNVGNIIDQTYAKTDTVPTKVSQLLNDKNYLTEHQDISEKADKSDTYTKTEIDTNYAKKNEIPEAYDDTDIKNRVSALEKIDHSLYLTEHQDISGKVDKELGKGLSEANYTETEKQKLSGIADNANNYVHPTTPGNQHIPAGGASGLILTFSEEGTALWADTSTKLEEQFNTLNTALEELQIKQLSLSKQVTELNMDSYSYGVEWDVTVSSPILTRIGNPLLHKSLPILSAYRGCVANNGVVNYYLYPDDWAYKEDGSTPSVLDGTDGTVRVHTPKFYGKSGSNGNKRWVRISLVKIDDSWVEIPELLIDAYRSTVDNTVSSTPKAVSVVNTTEAFRGGGNRALFDEYLTTELDTKDIFRSDLGKPRTNISRSTMRTYATNAGSELLCYEYYKWIFYWNYVIEYANFNSLAAYNAELTSDGYRQGGLGPGVTDWGGSSWSKYNRIYPLTPCGYCNGIGNFTGVRDLVIPECTATDGTSTVATHTFKVPRWRGFDNPFGDIWTNLDGIVIQRKSDEVSSVYTTTNKEEFTDVIGSKTIAGYEVSLNGYIKEFDLGETAEIIPSSCTEASSTTYMCDYHYCDVVYTGLRIPLVGGDVTRGGDSGLGYFNSNSTVSSASASSGFRTLNRVS